MFKTKLSILLREYASKRRYLPCSKDGILATIAIELGYIPLKVNGEYFVEPFLAEKFPFLNKPLAPRLQQTQMPTRTLAHALGDLLHKERVQMETIFQWIERLETLENATRN